MNQTAYIDLAAMRAVDIRTADLATLVDMRDIKVNKALPKLECALDYIRQSKNPYLLKYKNMAVKIGHTKTDATLNDAMEHFFLSL